MVKYTDCEDTGFFLLCFFYTYIYTVKVGFGHLQVGSFIHLKL